MNSPASFLSMEEDEWFASNARQIRQEPLFENQLNGLGVNVEWLDDAIRGLDTAVSKHPEIFPKAPGTPFSVARLVVYGDAPALRVYFTYDATEVRLICVEFAE